MKILRLLAPASAKTAQYEEDGMSYQVICAGLQSQGPRVDLVVFGGTYAVALRATLSLPSLSDLPEVVSFSDMPPEAFTDMNVIHLHPFVQRPVRAVLAAAIAQAAASKASGKPSPATPPPPGAQLSLKTQTNGQDAFLRFSYSESDPRVSEDGKVAAKTYATTFRDGAIVNSGFSAVGRYALPVPMAAMHVTLLTPPKGTTIEIGTAVSNFGQGGGGVEVFFPNAFKNESRQFSIPAY